MTPENFIAITKPLPEAMFLVSGDGRMLAANNVANRLAGISSPAEVGDKFISEKENLSWCNQVILQPQ